MIEVDLPTILTVAGAIIAPLLTVIGVLYNTGREERRLRDEDQKTARAEYNTMRDKMQDKIDASNQKANDAISTVTTALNAMTGNLSNSSAERQKAVEEWSRFKDDLLRQIRDIASGRDKG